MAQIDDCQLQTFPNITELLDLRHKFSCMIYMSLPLKPQEGSPRCLLQLSQPSLSASFKTTFNPKWISSQSFSCNQSWSPVNSYLIISPTNSHLHHSSPGPH